MTGRVSLINVLFLLVVLSFSCTDASAHTREKKRIEALEKVVKKENAFIVQRVSVVEQTVSHNVEAVKERQEHGKRLERRMATLEENVAKGLRAVRDTLGKEVDKKLAALKESDERQLKRIKELEKLFESHRGTMEAMSESLAGLRKFMASNAKLNKENSETLNNALQSIKKVEDKRYRQVVSRIDSLLKIVDEENSKLRHAIAGSSGSSGSGSKYVVVGGDNLWSIARKSGISRDDLLKVNPSLRGESAVIHPGDTVQIP